MKTIVNALLCLGILAICIPGYCDTNTQEASTACADKEDGDACDFVNNEGTSLDGFCKVNQSSQGKLTCVVSQ
ncbi:MAG: hypothetical protein AB7V32_03430 [Candidatus Berkiella sp.]